MQGSTIKICCFAYIITNLSLPSHDKVYIMYISLAYHIMQIFYELHIIFMIYSVNKINTHTNNNNNNNIMAAI